MTRFTQVALIVVLGLVVLLGLGAAARPEAPANPKPLSTEDEIREAKRRLDRLESDRADLQDRATKSETAHTELRKELEAAEGRSKDALQKAKNRFDLVALHNPPVGSVVAFSGELPANPVDRKAWEEKVGWALCNGEPFDPVKYKLLYEVLKGNQLPDYQGLFLRGLDPIGQIDPDRKVRTVGSLQDDAIGQHKHPVTVSGNVTINYKDWKVTKWGTPNNENDDKASGGRGYKEDKDDDRSTTASATLQGTAEFHQGAASETRVKNRAVHYLIKTR